MANIQILLITPLLFFFLHSGGQTYDTLSNMKEDVELYAPRYQNPGQWGFILGQNSSYRQQYAEKYYIEGSTELHGLIAHLTGTFSHPENYVEFNVYEVASSGLPGARIGGKQVRYKDLDLSGNPMSIEFSTPFEVSDSFFVTFNVLDYLHGGFDGDTLGLYMGEEGSRIEEDLVNFGRNAVQAHNHSKEDWKDFYTQNFTPIATHFALFPVVQELELTPVKSKMLSSEIKIGPNPSNGLVYLDLKNLPSSDLGLVVMNSTGWIVYKEKLNFSSNEINLRFLAPGMYFLCFQTHQSRYAAQKIIIQ